MNEKIGTDEVHSPPHYAMGSIEVIEAIEDWQLEFHLANSVKYLARAGKKGDGSRQTEIKDLQKAKWYIDRRIELLTAEIEKRQPRRPNEMMEKKS